MWARTHRIRPQRDEPFDPLRQRLFTPSPRASLGRAGRTSGDAGTILDLQRLAGNRAVSASIASARSAHADGRAGGSGGRAVVVGRIKLDAKPKGPPGGLKAIREMKGGRGILCNTIASIDPSPPLMRPETPQKTEAGWTCRSRTTRVPQPYFDEYWPTAGRHTLAPHIYLDVTDEWEGKLKQGEDEHVADSTLGWEVTWGRVAKAVDALAKKPGKPQPTEEAARLDLWQRFARCLPADLRPAGASPTEEAQLARWGFEPKTTLFRVLFGATEARDLRNWHLPETDTDIVGKDEFKTLKAGGSRIGQVTPEELIKEFRAKAAKGTK
jgi:hypothetical protein